MTESLAAREHTVRAHLAARGVQDPAVLGAFRAIPREAFLPPELHEFAYQDSPLPIEQGQTISQPYIVALMTAAVELSAFFLHLREPDREALRYASLPHRFDEYVWIDETRAVRPLTASDRGALPPAHPFAP